jgi:peroxiredoxin
MLGGCAHGPPTPDPLALTLTDTRGARINLGAYRGKVLLVNFFATWCFPCLAQLPQLEYAQISMGSRGLQVIGIGLDLDGDKVLEPFRQFYGLTYPILLGGDRFGQPGLPMAPIVIVPTTILLGRDGQAISHWEGILPTEEMDRVVQDALKR